MSKLDGNERWKSKMLLTEHSEQYDQRHHHKLVGRPTPEELTKIRDYIMLPHMITMIKKCIDDTAYSHIALKGVVARCLEVMMFRVSDDYYVLKKELNNHNIKVVSEETDNGILYFRYFCRGYEERFGIVREALRSEISIRMTQYTDELGIKLRAGKK